MTSDTPRGDAAYCRMIALARTTPCLGWEAKAKSGAFGTAEFDAHKRCHEEYGKHLAYTECEQEIATLKVALAAANAKLAAKPDVAGLVDAYDAARYRFEEWDGDVLIPEQNADLEWRVTEKNAARQRIIDALQAKPNVAGLVEATDNWLAGHAGDSAFTLLPRLRDALLSLSAQLQEKEELAQCYKEDYEDSRKALTSLAKKFAEKEAEVDRLNVLLSAVGFLSKEDGSK